MVTTAIIQARMRSTRLPGKVLEEVAGRPLLWHVVHRVRAAQLIDNVVVATSVDKFDDAIADFCEKNSITCFRGDHDDVLDRFYHAAKKHKSDVVVRITADCPLIDPKVIERVISTHFSQESDYTANNIIYTYPDGLDVEVFSMQALETAWKAAESQFEREHVTPYIKSSKNLRTHNVQNDIALPQKEMRWTVDDARDLDFVRKVFERASSEQMGTDFGMKYVLDLINREPDITKMNANTVRNEGLYLSLLKEKPVPERKRSLAKSQALRERASAIIPSCSQTFSKSPTQFVQGVAPVFLDRGDGCRVWDVDGNDYIDYPMALGPLILGYCDPDVNSAVREQLEQGSLYSLPHKLEIEVAEMLTEIVPCAEMVRFGKNGSDVTSGAIRAARAYTGRDLVACSGYHGWQDWYIGTTTRKLGVPENVRELTLSFTYNDIQSLERIFSENPGKVAAVILEPMGVVPPVPDFLRKVKEITRREGAVLIFDEIITGFRWANGGAQEYFGVQPDLACFGKAMANGFPLSAVVGQKDIMKVFDDIFFSFTFGGETLSLAAAKATITKIIKHNVIDHIAEHGRQLQDGYDVLARQLKMSQHTECLGIPARTVVTFKDAAGNESLELKSLFQQECFKRGVFFLGLHNISFSHGSSEIMYTLHVYRTALEILKEAIDTNSVRSRLDGTPVQPVFRKA